MALADGVGGWRLLAWADEWRLPPALAASRCWRWRRAVASIDVGVTLVACIGGRQLPGLAAGGCWGLRRGVARHEERSRAVAGVVSARKLFGVGVTLAAAVGGGQLLFGIGLMLAAILTDSRLLAVALRWFFPPALPAGGVSSWRGVALAARVGGGRRLLAVVGGWHWLLLLAPAGCFFAGVWPSPPAIVAGGCWRWWGVAPAAGFGARQLLALTVGGRFLLREGRSSPTVAPDGCWRLGGAYRVPRVMTAGCCWRWWGRGAWRRCWRRADAGVGHGMTLAAGVGDGRL